ncbi:MAG: hypothetical protein QM739_04250 [Propionivibrio sp.]
MNAPSKKPGRRKPAGKAKVTPARGRPTLYQAAYAEQARRLALLGQTDAEMAAFFGVAERTIHYWKEAHPDFLQSLKEGKEEADAHVAESLYRAAIGGSTITETKVQSDAEGNIVGRTTETKQVPANTTAMIFWLKNRQPDKWRDRVEAEVSVSGVGELAGVYEDAMKRARERQQAILAERGLSLEAGGG